MMFIAHERYKNNAKYAQAKPPHNSHKTGAEQVSGEQIFPTLFIWPLYYLLCVSQHFCTIPFDNMLLPLSKIRPLFTNIGPGLVIGVLQYLFGLEHM